MRRHGKQGYQVEAFGVATARGFTTPTIDFHVAAGQTLALVGTIGCGKTLILECLAAAHRPGVTGIGTSSTARVALIPQDVRLSVLPTDRVWTLLRMNPWALFLERFVGLRPSGTAGGNEALGWMKQLNLDPGRLLDLRFRDLSASERLRILLCASLLSAPDVLLIDGWNETIDASDRRLVAKLLERERSHGLAVVVSSRTYPLRDLAVDHVVEMTDSREEEPEQVPVPLVRKTADIVAQEHALLEVERLVVQHAEVRFGKRRPVAQLVDEASLLVQRGEVVALLGPAASGKTVLFEAIAGLRPTAAGALRVSGHDVTHARGRRQRRLRRDVQLVFQDAASVLEGRRHVLSHLEEARSLARGQVASSAEWLEKLGLAGRLLELPADQLSASESQRVDLGRSLIVSPQIVLWDGPEVGGVDSDGGLVAGFIRAETARGTSFLIATSHPETAAAIADRVVVLHAGRVIEMGSTSEILQGPAHPLTLALLNHEPLLPADPTAPPIGCAFVGQCTRRILPLCKEKRPLLASLSTPDRDATHRRVACFAPMTSEPEELRRQVSAPVPPPLER